MAIYQIFIKHLDGRTSCLHLPSPTITGSSLKQTLHSSTKIPLHSLRIVSGNRDISDDTLISAPGDDRLFPSCTVLLRLRGGKGGFGSLLRGAATKAGQKKTNNFDACRDMSGRRLRHVNAERKLEEWKAEAEDRRLEKIADDFLKKKAKSAKKNTSGGDAEKYVAKYREDSAKCMEEVEASVRESFELYEASKRKVLPASGPGASKRLKIWLGKGKAVESDSDEDEDDENEKSVVLDDGGCLVRSQDEEGSSGSVSVSAGQSDGEAPGGGSSESNLEEENCNSYKGNLELGEVLGSVNCTADAVCPVELQPASGPCDQGGLDLGEGSGSEDINVGLECSGIVAADADVEGSGSEAINAERRAVDTETESATEPSLGICEGTVIQNASISCLGGLLNFKDFSSAAEMEVLGLERLKAELQAHGLKCGGTLQERAARLFLLKTTPIEKLPKKLLAKPTTGGKGK
ncbi:hypothetical protein MRB53_002534 [Persea americana]|uniref:Uncharacterized protein n=1 Tax=Persea americana TaxID=3435 RepID=A0ACC2MUU9_PERAE|nr:hypothetical protein MRB53_002534 [Persea americana]